MRDLKQIAEDISSQDNRCTASPMIILLQVQKEYVAHPDYARESKEVWVDQVTGDYIKAETEVEIRKRLREYYDGDHTKKIKRGKDYECFTMSYYWETENVFFTDKGYEDHMRINGHNYRNTKTRTYGIHAFRNQEMKTILDEIMKHKEVARCL